MSTSTSTSPASGISAPDSATTAPASASGVATSTANTQGPKLTLEQLFARPAPFTFNLGLTDPVRTAATASWIVYTLTERATGRVYVGITQRTLQQRIGAHLSQARRIRGIRPDGLMAALRAMIARGQAFADAFTARIVARAVDAAEAAEQERKWVTMLNCRTPDGLNCLPGGGVGGPANARELEVEISPCCWRWYPSIYAAIGARNRDLRQAGQPLLDPGVVYTRLTAGWSAEEALGYRDHVDGRGLRAAFRVGSHEFDTLRQAAGVTGLSIDTLRSRHHRQATAALSDGPIDIGTDRRSGNGSANRTLLAIIWPDTGEQLTADAFSRRTGVPKATVIHRWHRARRVEAARVARGEPPFTAARLAARLQRQTDRRKLLTLVLPDGRCWSGGERELVGRVLADGALEASRPERLSASGVRRRLRLLSRFERRHPGSVRQAFGFAPDADDAGHAATHSGNMS